MPAAPARAEVEINHPKDGATVSGRDVLVTLTIRSFKIVDRVGIKNRRTVLPLDYIRATKNKDLRAAQEAALTLREELDERVQVGIGIHREHLFEHPLRTRIRHQPIVHDGDLHAPTTLSRRVSVLWAERSQVNLRARSSPRLRSVSRSTGSS